jgi:hypothetical protein
MSALNAEVRNCLCLLKSKNIIENKQLKRVASDVD